MNVFDELQDRAAHADALDALDRALGQLRQRRHRLTADERRDVADQLRVLARQYQDGEPPPPTTALPGDTSTYERCGSGSGWRARLI